MQPGFCAFLGEIPHVVYARSPCPLLLFIFLTSSATSFLKTLPTSLLVLTTFALPPPYDSHLFHVLWKWFVLSSHLFTPFSLPLQSHLHRPPALRDEIYGAPVCTKNTSSSTCIVPMTGYDNSQAFFSSLTLIIRWWTLGKEE